MAFSLPQPRGEVRAAPRQRKNMGMGCNNSAPPSSYDKMTMKTEMTDRQLVTLVLGGKTQAYSDIVSRHSALVFAKAMGVVRCRDLDAEIAQ